MSVRMVVVGGSWGGLDALGRLLGAMKPGGSLAVAAVLHRGRREHDGAMVRFLSDRSALPVSEPEDKEPLVDGHAYLAPAEYHLLVERGRLALSLDPPVRQARPSVDVLFESAADAYGPEAAAVVLTGANDDGSRGLCRVRRRGGATLVQDPATAVRREMPDAAIATGMVDTVARLEELAARLDELGSAS